ncbi:hypothetical protein [Kineococcus sp. SYSU DK005]|uniref:hypothetical protein n=1 Tax=Kineococcus sp. SYSU DK005 TaxID=3383126 RepID=UPI003D7E872E
MNDQQPHPTPPGASAPTAARLPTVFTPLPPAPLAGLSPARLRTDTAPTDHRLQAQPQQTAPPQQAAPPLGTLQDHDLPRRS